MHIDYRFLGLQKALPLPREEKARFMHTYAYLFIFTQYTHIYIYAYLPVFTYIYAYLCIFTHIYAYLSYLRIFTYMIPDLWACKMPFHGPGKKKFILRTKKRPSRSIFGASTENAIFQNLSVLGSMLACWPRS